MFRIIIIRERDLAPLRAELAEAIGLLRGLSKEVSDMAKTITEQLTELETAVTSNTDAENSAIVLLERIPQLILDAAQGADPATLARLQAASDAIKNKSTELAAAVLANTPVAPTPTEAARRAALKK